jgi:hypothetical protein
LSCPGRADARKSPQFCNERQPLQNIPLLTSDSPLRKVK